jgi:hypothetical protein
MQCGSRKGSRVGHVVVTDVSAEGNMRRSCANVIMVFDLRKRAFAAVDASADTVVVALNSGEDGLPRDAKVDDANWRAYAPVRGERGCSPPLAGVPHRSVHASGGCRPQPS